MSGFELRPLGLGELLDRGFTIYRRNFWLFAGIMAIPSCLMVPMRFFLLRNRGAALPWSRPLPQSYATAYSFGFLFVYWIIYAVVQAATTCAVADAYLGRFSTVRGAYGKIRGKFWRVMGVTFNVGIRVFGLAFICIIFAGIVAGVLIAVSQGNVTPNNPVFVVVVLSLAACAIALVLWFSARYAVSLPALLLEQIKGRAAIRRSVELSRGHRGQLFVAILLGVIVSYAAAIIFQGPFYAGIAITGIRGQLPTWLSLALSTSSTIGGAIASPLVMIFVVVFYYDLRIRKEGFDLQHMMASLPDAQPDALPNAGSTESISPA